MTVTAYARADRSERIAPHIDHAGASDIFKREHVETFVTDLELWK